MVTKRTLFSGGRLPNVRAASLPNAAERGWQPKSALFRGRQKEISQKTTRALYRFTNYITFVSALALGMTRTMCLFVFLCGCVCSLEWVPRV